MDNFNAQVHPKLNPTPKPSDLNPQGFVSGAPEY